ncbi:hypothetical protein L6Q96_15365 [Candidatus Binatia bacterium]|nr:hypothetical protein [Candidatus Binatia bacterium]
MTTAPVPDPIAQALAAERVRNGRIVGFVRLGAVSTALLLDRTLALASLSFIGPPLPLFFLWIVLGVAVTVAAQRSERVAERSGLAVPLMDMPFLYSMMRELVDRLAVGGFADDARSIAVSSTVFFVLLLFLTSMLIGQREVYFAAFVAMTLEVALGVQARAPDLPRTAPLRG